MKSHGRWSRPGIAGGALLLLAYAGCPPARAAAPAQQAAVKTAKERLGEKATDEQRVDDCKVPPDRRTRARPNGCPWDNAH